jgi:TetR/AcrR family transcriptional regulator
VLHSTNDHLVTKALKTVDAEAGLFERLPEEKRHRITGAALEEFAALGYRAASMNSVVERAGISKGALFKYFGSKEGLFGYVYRLALGKVKEYLRRVRDGSVGEPFFTRLEKVVRAGTAFIRENPGLADLYYRITHSGDAPYPGQILTSMRRESRRFLRKLVEEGIRRGDLRSDLDPDKAAFVIECVLDRYLEALRRDRAGRSAGEPGEADREEWIADMIGIFQRGMNHDVDDRIG